MYGWIITRDYLFENGDDTENSVGIIGNRDTIFDKETILEYGKTFRMKDDDGNIYYEGKIIESHNLKKEDSSITGFEPLDDFGMPNAGCTSIEYLEDGKWIQL